MSPLCTFPNTLRACNILLKYSSIPQQIPAKMCILAHCPRGFPLVALWRMLWISL